MIIGICDKSSKNYLKYLLLIMIFTCLCIYFTSTNILKDVQIRKQIIQTRANAFIISSDCNSVRFNFTKDNIKRVFPNFFNIHCFKPVPLDDYRIDQSLSLTNKKLASNLITFVTLWTYEFTKYSRDNELEWSFIFEDDVNFVEPSRFSLSDYINAVQELMHHPEIQLKHGIFYLGICGPTFASDNHSLITSFSNKSLLSRKGCGRCAHGMALTTKRAKDFWMEISLYCPIPNGPTDIYIHNHCDKSGNYYILGSNLHWPPSSRHYGIAFQDRQQFPTGVW